MNDRTQFLPRLLTKSQAAAYCGVSAHTFTAKCPVAPISLGKGDRLRRYDVRQIDRWIDALGGGAEADHYDWLGEMDRSDDDRTRQRH